MSRNVVRSMALGCVVDASLGCRNKDKTYYSKIGKKNQIYVSRAP